MAEKLLYNQNQSIEKLYELEIWNWVDSIVNYLKDVLKTSYNLYINLDMNYSVLSKEFLSYSGYLVWFKNFLRNYLEKNNLKEEILTKFDISDELSIFISIEKKLLKN